MLTQNYSSVEFQQIVKDHFHYSGLTGLLWRKKRFNDKNTNKSVIAGSPDMDGYNVVNFHGRSWKAHHLIWIYAYGYKPKLIDHINRDVSDNRLTNLRLANKSINSINRGLQSNNKSGQRGVSWNKSSSKWESYITHNNERIGLGLHSKYEDAVNARLDKEKTIQEFKVFGVGKES